MVICENFASSIKGGHTGCFMHFDARRVAILLIGGDKTGNNRWYEEYVPRADELYDEHLAQLKREGAIDDGEEI